MAGSDGRSNCWAFILWQDSMPSYSFGSSAFWQDYFLHEVFYLVCFSFCSFVACGGYYNSPTGCRNKIIFV